MRSYIFTLSLAAVASAAAQDKSVSLIMSSSTCLLSS